MVAERAVLAEIAEATLCQRDFVRFLRHVKVRGDDPLYPQVTAWQPWPHLIERAQAWQGGALEVVLKDRQLGFTWLLAAYFDWRARNGWSCGVISKGQDEARAVLARVKFLEGSLPDYLRTGASFRADEATYPSSGMIHAFPSTPDAGVSYTLQLVAFDEAAFHPYGAANYAAITPTFSAGGQLLIMSTADPQMAGSGFMPDIYWASKRGETGYKAVFVPWHARPGRDAAWLERERAKYAGRMDEFSAYYAETDAEAFAGRSGLVYGMFNEAIHVQPAPCPWEACKVRIAGVDWGGGDPTAVVLLGRTANGRIHQYGEFYQRGPVSVTDIAQFLIDWDLRGRISAVECDPSQGVSIATLNMNALGGRVFAADNAADGKGLTSMLLEQRRLTIDPSCTNSIYEFPGYRWANRTDPNDKTRYATSTTVDHHADAMDARRYALKKLLRFETVALTRAAVWRGSKKPVNGYV